ncbi:MAG: hypothetical protein ABSE73_08050 [Planctomycetota bacterium]
MLRSPVRWKAHVALAQGLLLAAASATLGATEAPKDLLPGDLEEKKEKIEEPPLKYSAWCAFRDLSDTRPPRKEDPRKDYTRAAAEGWSGFARRGQWANIVLELKNTTEKTEYRGTASIEFDPVKENDRGEKPYQTHYRQEFDVGPQTVKQYSFSVLCPEDGWTGPVPVSITANGRGFDVRLVTLHDLDAGGQDFVVVVSESSGAFRHLATKKGVDLGLDESQQHERMVAVVEPQELPSRWHDLTLANLIVIDGPPREQLTGAQWEALKSYVQAGGQVLITAGKDPSRLKGPVEDLAGITVRSMIEVSALDGGENEGLNWKPRDPTWKLPMLDVSVSPKGSPKVRYSLAARKVEMCSRSYGLGSVTFLPFSLSDPRLENWAGRALIPLKILEDARGRRLFVNTTADDEFGSVRPTGLGNPYPSRYIQPDAERHQTLMGLRHALDEAFAVHTAVQPPKNSMVLEFLLLYLLCAVPGNYLLFGWLRRREIAWLAVPVWAGTFSAIAYAVGYMGQTGELTVNEVSLLEAAAGQDVAMARTFVGLYAPRRGDYRIEFPQVKVSAEETFDLQAGPGQLINPSWSEARGFDFPQLYLAEDGQRLTVEKLLVQQRSTRRLEIVHRARLGGGLDLTVRRSKNAEPDALDIDLHNNTGLTLYYPVYIHEGKAYPLGATQDNVLPPGEGKKFLGLTASGGVDPNQAFFGRMIVLSSAHGVLERTCATALNEYVRNQTGKFRQGLICAWVENEKGILPVKIAEGRREAREPKTRGLSMLLVPVTIKTDVSASGKLAGELKVSYVPNSNATGQWMPVSDSGSIPLTRDQSPPAQPYNAAQPPIRVVACLKVDLPPNYRDLDIAGLQLHLRFKLAAVRPKILKPPSQAPAPALDGELRAEVRMPGNNEWSEIYNHPEAKIKSDKSITIVLPWGNYLAVSNGVMVVRLYFTPTGAAQAAKEPLQLQEVECKARQP